MADFNTPLSIAATSNDGSSLVAATQTGTGRALHVLRAVASATRSMVNLAQTHAAGGAEPVLDIQQTTVASPAINVTSDGATSVFKVSGAGAVTAASLSTTGNSTVGTTTVYNAAGFARTFGVYDAGSANISIANASAQYQFGVTGSNLNTYLGGVIVTTTSSTGLAVTGTTKTTTGMAVGGATPGTNGLAFPATAVAVADANTLDDYEEGTWTPVLKDASAGNAATAATTSANYTKIGRVVNFSLALVDINTTGLTAGNQIYITGLPFASANVIAQPSISMSVSNVSSTSGSLRAFVGTNNTELTLFNSTTTGSTVAIVSQITSTTGDLYISGSYIA